MSAMRKNAMEIRPQNAASPEAAKAKAASSGAV